MSGKGKNKINNANAKQGKKGLSKKGDAESEASNGIRGKYETLGVLGFYSTHGHEYENPHGEIVTKAIATLMSLHDFGDGGPTPEVFRVLDLACGSGEVTVALDMWLKQKVPVPPLYVDAFRHRAEGLEGADADDDDDADADAGDDVAAADTPSTGVSKPESERVRRPPPVAVTLPPPLVKELDIVACDPYTHEAYVRRTGRTASRWSFEDIADGVLSQTRAFDLCACSFAMHLCAPSRLFLTLWQLSSRCRRLLLLSPHKRPHVREADGWRLELAFRVEKVHLRLYRSLQFRGGDEGEQ